MSKTKTLTLTMLAGTVFFFMGLWMFSTVGDLTMLEYVVAGTVVLIVLATIPIIRGRLKNEKLGLPADDELSESIKQKAEAKAFGISFYMWAFIAMVSMDTSVNPIVPVGIGLVTMGLIFMGLWFYYSRTGVDYENKN